MKLLLQSILLALFITTQVAHAQIGISGSAHPSAALDVKSPGNDKAFYPPRLTTAQRLAIPNPQAGAFVYDLDKGTMFLHDGQNWLPVATTEPSLIPPVSRTASDGGGYDSFGSFVAISGDYAIVGAPTKFNSVGAAYIFVRSGNGWTEQQKIMISDTAANDRFGQGVAIYGDYAVVGATGKSIAGNSSQGAAYVFTRSGTSWTQQQRITAADGAVYDNFGRSVATTADYIMVGVGNKLIGSNTSQGATYIFQRSGNVWTQSQRLVSTDGAAGDGFGSSVAISGDYAVIGAPGKSAAGYSNAGAAYIYFLTRGSGNTWIQGQKIIAYNPGSGDLFGTSVAISGSYIVVGASGKSVGANSFQGVAYLFSQSGSSWTFQQQLTANDGSMYDNFGYSVAVSGNYGLIGAPNKSGTANSMGAAYFFKLSNTGSNQQRKIVDVLVPYSRNGYSVGISNGTFIIGTSFSSGKVLFGTTD